VIQITERVSEYPTPKIAKTKTHGRSSSQNDGNIFDFYKRVPLAVDFDVIKMVSARPQEILIRNGLENVNETFLVESYQVLGL